MNYYLRVDEGGLGSYGLGADLVPPPMFEDCYPTDSTCVERNVAKSNAYALAVQMAQNANNMAQCLANAQNATPGAQRDSVIASCHAAYGGSATEPVYVMPPPQSSSKSGGGYAATPGTKIQLPDGTVLTAGDKSDSIFSSSTDTGCNPAFQDCGGQKTKNVFNNGSAQQTVQNATGGIVIPANPPQQAVVQESTGFDFSSIPWWGYALAAGAAFMMFKGNK